MPQTLYLFNPENDLALAAGTDNYTPPRAAAELGRCAQLLPMWLADESDAVLVTDDEASHATARLLKERFGLKAATVTSAPVEIAGCSPWGWSRAARRRFIRAGTAMSLLPSDEWLDRHRRLSSRITTIELCHRLGIEPPVAARSPEEAVAAVAANECHGLHSFLKMPWSCSGRGVFATDRMSPSQLHRRAADIIRAQGAVMVEPDRHRVRDFAVLYRISDGTAAFHALSLFETGQGGAYSGNLVISDDEIIHRLGTDPMPWAESMAKALTETVGPHYQGWAGVDMMTTVDGHIWPCTELNLRTTMGIVAAAMRPFFDRPMLLAPSPRIDEPYMPQPL